MIFDFKNIGIVDEAKIEVNGLTIITGLNDIGKSFLSKAIFSIIKTNKEATREVRELRFQELQQQFSHIQNGERYSLVNSSTPQLQSAPLLNKISQAFNSPISDGENSLELEIKDFEKKTIDLLNLNSHPQVIQVRGSVIANFSAAIDKTIDIIKTRIQEPEVAYKNYYNNVIIPQLFKRQINSIKNKDLALDINIIGENGKRSNIIIKNNLAEKFDCSLSEKFNDAVYIESPTSIQSITFILNSLAFGGTLLNASQQRIAGLPYHIYDLVYKIVNNANNLAPNEFIDNINKIRATVGGKLFYDQTTRSIVLSKENQENVFDFNIASGIKGLGILDILLSENILNSKTLLIIDEPEVHLHPTWEVEYGRILVQLSKIVPIIISSHSPSLLSTLPEFIKEYETEGITKWYFGERNPDSNTSTFKDVTSDISDVFVALSKPIRDRLV